jgi:hypothetical protein
MKTWLPCMMAVMFCAFASSCSRHEGGSESSYSETSGAAWEEHLPPEYAFIETNLDKITLEEITNKLGPYTRIGRLSLNSSDEFVCEFDLPDHSALLVVMERRLDARNRVHRVRRARFLHETNDFRLYPF